MIGALSPVVTRSLSLRRVHGTSPNPIILGSFPTPPEPVPKTSPSKNMASTVPISVAIYDNPGIMHWSLFIETESDAQKTRIHVLGARQRYFPVISTPSDARAADSLIELLPLCRIDASKIEILKNIAYDTPIRNELADWSCQDYVLAILDRLEEVSIIDAANGDYISNKEAVAAKRESWL